MNDRAINVDRVFDLAGAVCDDCASENDCAELDSIVVADETSGRRYWDYCRMHVMLGMEARVHQALQKACERDNLDLAALTPWECDALLAVLPPAASPVSSPILGFLSTTLHGTIGFLSSDWPVAYLVATVITGIGALVGSHIYVSRHEQVANNCRSPAIERQLEPQPKVEMVGRITGMVDCKWAKGGVPLLGNDAVSLGHEFKIESGLLEIGYNIGARVILQGPVTYVVESKNGGFLPVGKLTGRAEAETANGFSIRTPTAIVVDLGTEFGVTASAEGTTQVHVLQGTVDVRRISQQGGAERHERLTEGQAIGIGRRGSRTVAFVPRSFARRLQCMTDTPAEAAYIEAVLADKPLGYWPLNEAGHSGKFTDRSGNGFHGFAEGMIVSGQAGPFGAGSSRRGAGGRPRRHRPPSPLCHEQRLFCGSLGLDH